MPCKQQKKNPVSFLAGGPGTIRTIQKAPQVPPKEPELDLAAPQGRAKAIKSRMLSYRVDTVLRPTLPKWKCDHGILINEDEIRFQALWKRKYHTPKEPPISFECIRCFPICVHGLRLTPAEISSGKRFSKTCPECIGKFTNLAGLSAYLQNQNLGEHHGLSLSEGAFTTSYGYTITKTGKNYARFGGSKEMEGIDASNVEILETENGVIAADISSSAEGVGWGSDTILDDDFTNGARVDDLGDPIIFGPSELMKGFERARTDATRDGLDIVSYEIVPSEDKLAWIVLADGQEISRHNTRKEAKREIKTRTEFDYLNFKKPQSRNAAKIEHKEEDVVTAPQIPDTPPKLKGVKEQKTNRKIWELREEHDLQKEITEKIERYDVPVRAQFVPNKNEEPETDAE